MEDSFWERTKLCLTQDGREEVAETDGWVFFFFSLVGKKSLHAKNERLLAG